MKLNLKRPLAFFDLETTGTNIGVDRIVEISIIKLHPEGTEEVKTWRKANQIHKWFVDNVQDGSDDCKTYHVSYEQLRSLLDLCEAVITASKLVPGEVMAWEWWDRKTETWRPHLVPGKVIEDPTTAKALLPTFEGFFYGSYEYDQEYLNDVIETRDWCRQMLDDDAQRDVESQIVYSSSW